MTSRPLLGDTLTAVGVAAGALGLLATGGPDPGPSDLAAFGVALLGLIGRRRFTVAALGLTVTAAVVALIATGTQKPALTLVITALMFTWADRAQRRPAWIVTGLIVTGLIVVAAAVGTPAVDTIDGAWVIVGTALGDAARGRRDVLAATEERARQAEQSREDEARRRVAEERLRIARELHDVVAHHVAAVKVQATGARHVLNHRPEQVGPALEHISRLSDEVLREMGSMLGLLRHSPGRSLEPAPGLDRLPRLLGDFAAAGLTVEHERTGTARPLPVLADLAAYRIVQEGLTNAQRHGTGTARLRITYTEDSVTVEITNPIAPEGFSGGTGHGLIGMRERVAANDGTFSAAACSGVFTLRARLSAPALEPAA